MSAADRRPPNCDDEFLTVAEVATILCLNQQTIRNWIIDGKMPAVRIGRRVRITRADLRRVIDDGYSSAAVPSPDERQYTTQGFWDGEPHEPAATHPAVEASGDTSRSPAHHSEQEPADT